MPPKVFKIPLLTGGINNEADPAYIKDEESTALNNFIPNIRGRLRLSGTMMVKPLSYNDSDTSLALATTNAYHTSGYGLYYFRSDYTMLSAENTYLSNGNPNEVSSGIGYYVFQDNKYVKIYDPINKFFLTTNINGATGARAGVAGSDISTKPYVLPVYYYGDNALRISAAHTEGVGGSTFHRRYLGFINRTLFDGDGSTYTAFRNHKRWYQDTAKILPPSASGYTQDVGSEKPGKMAINFQNGAVGSDLTFSNGKEGVHIEVAYSQALTSSTWQAKVYKFYGTYIYDGSQESSVFELGEIGAGGVSANTAIAIGLTVTYSDNDDNAQATTNGYISSTGGGTGLHINPRITGSRLYFSDPDDGHGILYHLLDIDFIKGCKKVDESSYTAWAARSETDHETYQCPDGVMANLGGNGTTAGFLFANPPKIVTYEDINGYGPNEDLNPEFNCAAMIGKRVYIGNVKVNGEVFNDRIMRSPLNFEGKPQFDTFPETHFLDIGADDGDKVIQLIASGDKLIVFKENSVSVLNVSKFGAEFIEQSFQYVGIKNPCQAVSTNYGACWVNPSGCFIIENNKLINLVDNKILKQGQLKSYQKNMLWNFSDKDYNNVPSIGYYQKQDQLILAFNIAKEAPSRPKDCWIYSFKSGAWSFHAGAMDTYQVRSNFINNNLGELLQTGGYYNGTSATDDKLTLSYWNPLSTSKDECVYATKDLNFGSPGINKKIYKVGITYSTSQPLTGIQPFFAINGDDEIAQTFVSSQGELNGSGIIEAEAGSISTEILKFYENGVYKVNDSSNNYYLIQGSQCNEGGVVGDKAYIQYETDVTGSNWTIASGSSFLSIAGNLFVFTGSGDAVATHTFSTTSAITSHAPHVLQFNIVDIATNMTIQIIGLNIEDGGETTLATPSQYTDTGVKTVSFTPTTSHTTYKIKFLNSGSSGITTINNINLESAFMSINNTGGEYPRNIIYNSGTSTVTRSGGLITSNQTNTSGNHYITISNNVKHQIQIELSNTIGVGIKVRLIDVGTSSTALPNLKDISGYDSNSGSTYPQSVPLEGDGIDGASADFATLNFDSPNVATINTVSALNTSNRYYIVITNDRPSGLVDGYPTDVFITGSLSMREIGSYTTGFLNFTSPITCKSFQFMLKNSGTADASFTVRDVEIFYRLLKPKLTSD